MSRVAALSILWPQRSGREKAMAAKFKKHDRVKSTKNGLVSTVVKIWADGTVQLLEETGLRIYCAVDERGLPAGYVHE